MSRTPAPAPVTITRFKGGVAVSKEIAAPTRAGYILCVQDAGDHIPRVVRRAKTLSGIVAHWGDRGGEAGDAEVYYSSGEPLSPEELAAARRQLAEMSE